MTTPLLDRHAPRQVDPDATADVTRRRFLQVLGAAGLLAGCSSAGSSPTPAGAAPRTVVDTRGTSVTVPPDGGRIFVTSYRHVVDELLLLGAPPFAYGTSESEELPPWTRDAISTGGHRVEPFVTVYGTQVDYEALAALRPDVIVASAYEQESFATLEGIAPLVVIGDEGFDLDGSRLRLFGDVVGRPDRAAEVIAGLEDGFDRVRPPGGEVALVFGFSDGGAPKLAVEWGDTPGREGQLLTRLGFTIKSDWPFARNEFGYAEVSEENFGLLESADFALNIGPYPGGWAADKAALEGSAVLRELDLFRRGDFFFLTPTESQSIVQWTPLATPTLVETLNRVVTEREGRPR